MCAKLIDFLNGVGNNIRLVQSIPLYNRVTARTYCGLRDSMSSTICLSFNHRNFVGVIHMLMFFIGYAYYNTTYVP